MGEHSKNLKRNAFKSLKLSDLWQKSGDFGSENRLGSGLGAQIGPKRRPDRVQRGLGDPNIAPRRRRGAPRRRQDGPRRPPGGPCGGSWGGFRRKCRVKFDENLCQDKKIQETANMATTLKNHLFFNDVW